ncbi:minor capsid protein, partial [Aduncisulcus paluster]
MAGRYEQMQKATKLRPFWQYDAVNDKRTRPSHTALDGKTGKKAGYEIETEMPGPTMVKLSDGSEINVNPMPDKGWSQNVGKNWLAGLEPSEVDGKVKDLSTTALCRGGNFAKGETCKPPLKDLDAKHILEVKPKDILDADLDKDEHVL